MSDQVVPRELEKLRGRGVKMRKNKAGRINTMEGGSREAAAAVDAAGTTDDARYCDGDARSPGTLVWIQMGWIGKIDAGGVRDGEGGCCVRLSDVAGAGGPGVPTSDCNS